MNGMLVKRFQLDAIFRNADSSEVAVSHGLKLYEYSDEVLPVLIIFFGGHYILFPVKLENSFISVYGMSESDLLCFPGLGFIVHWDCVFVA